MLEVYDLASIHRLYISGHAVVLQHEFPHKLAVYDTVIENTSEVGLYNYDSPK